MLVWPISKDEVKKLCPFRSRIVCTQKKRKPVADSCWSKDSFKAYEVAGNGNGLTSLATGMSSLLGWYWRIHVHPLVALCQAPFLLDDANVGLVFPTDAIALVHLYSQLQLQCAVH